MISFALLQYLKSPSVVRQTPISWLLFQDNLGKPAPERFIYSGFSAASDDGVAVASAGLYVKHLHLVPDR